VRMAQTVGYASQSNFRLYLYDLRSVAKAREEFGPTLADAQAFVENATCNECGLAKCELRECFGCGEVGCDCIRSEGEHDDHDWCRECFPVCGGPCCNDW